MSALVHKNKKQAFLDGFIYSLSLGFTSNPFQEEVQHLLSKSVASALREDIVNINCDYQRVLERLKKNNTINDKLPSAARQGNSH